MSQIPSLQCLFCQHLNPPDADYCDRCDGQLNLQPCYRCEAVDLRTATHCYKCGGAFSRPPARTAGRAFSPAIVGQQVAHPAPGGMTIEGSAARVRSTRLSYPPPQRQSVDAVMSTRSVAPAAASRRGAMVWGLGIPLLLVIAAVAVYVYRVHVMQPAALPVPSSAPSVPSQADAGPRPGDGGQGAAAAQTPALSARPPVADAAPAANPSPATDAQAVARPERAAADKCPPAVAALGLCNPDTPQGRP